MAQNDVATATQLLNLWMRSEGEYKTGEDFSIHEEFDIRIVLDAESDPRGYYMTKLPHVEHYGPLRSIRIEEGRISFDMIDPLFLGNARQCKLRADTKKGVSETSWSGTISGPFFQPSSAGLAKMEGACTATLSRQEAEIAEEEIRLTGIVSLEDAERLSLLSGLPVHEIMSAFRIPHPKDEKWMQDLPQMGHAELMTVAWTAKGPLAREAAVRAIGENFLISHVSHTLYKVVGK